MSEKGTFEVGDAVDYEGRPYIITQRLWGDVVMIENHPSQAFGQEVSASALARWDGQLTDELVALRRAVRKGTRR